MSEPTVHTYRAADAGLWVNSYLVETATGVLVFDTNLLVSDIEALRARLAALKSPCWASSSPIPTPTTSTESPRWYGTTRCRSTRRQAWAG